MAVQPCVLCLGNSSIQSGRRSATSSCTVAPPSGGARHSPQSDRTGLASICRKCKNRPGRCASLPAGWNGFGGQAALSATGFLAALFSPRARPARSPASANAAGYRRSTSRPTGKRLCSTLPGRVLTSSDRPGEVTHPSAPGIRVPRNCSHATLIFPPPGRGARGPRRSHVERRINPDGSRGGPDDSSSGAHRAWASRASLACPTTAACVPHVRSKAGRQAGALFSAGSPGSEGTSPPPPSESWTGGDRIAGPISP